MSLAVHTSDSAAERFLQTVVVVDDNAYAPQDGSPGLIATLGDESIDEAAGSTEGQPSDLESAEDSDPEGFDTEVIVEGFADLGMNCAVLKPGRGEQGKDTARLLGLATRADVVILDWVIRTWAEAEEASTPSDPVSRTTLGLLLEVLRHDKRAGSRVRLICVYTGKSDTVAVIEEIEAALVQEFADVQLHPNKLRIDLGGVRIVILRKDRELPLPGAETIPAAELPKRVVSEFREFASDGLLPEIALQSLSAVRDQSHKLLRRFSSSLDPALISHRSTTSPAVAEQFALALVGDELNAILAATDAVGALRDERIDAYVEKRLYGRNDIPVWTSMNAKDSTKLTNDEAISVLTRGVGNDGKIHVSNRKLKTNISRSALLLDGKPAEVRLQAYDLDLRFSALSSLSRDCNYDSEQAPTPELRLGSLLSTTIATISPTSKRDSAETPGASFQCEITTQFWACMQPLCDSVRLDRPTHFPMMPLRRSRSEDKFDFVVKHGESYVSLETAGLKLREMSLPVFQPDTQLQVVMASWEDDVWQFTDEEDLKYTWLGDLRIDKAHKVLHSVVTTAGRIGIDEYEYYRNASTQR